MEMKFPTNKWITCVTKEEIEIIYNYCIENNILLNGVCEVDFIKNVFNLNNFVSVCFLKYSDTEEYYIVYLNSDCRPTTNEVLFSELDSIN